MCLEFASPAKINLFLRVTGRRPDGFHELESLMVPLDLSDRIEIRFGGQGIRVSCLHPEVPEDSRNLAWRAAALFRDRFAAKTGQVPFEGMAIDLEKIIPVGGGLGGGSSNGATVLAALNQRFDCGFTEPELMAMGLSLGADVPFFIHYFLHGTAALARGVGERLSPCPDLPPFSVLLCCPGIFSSTAKVFKSLDFRLTSVPNCTMNTGSNVLPKGQGAESWDRLENDLEGPAFRVYPEIGSIKKEMALLLQQQVFMSGSGSSLFALFSDPVRAESGFKTLSRAWSGSRKKVFLTRAVHSDRRV